MYLIKTINADKMEREKVAFKNINLQGSFTIRVLCNVYPWSI
jgi:hypothetical protein